MHQNLFDDEDNAESFVLPYGHTNINDSDIPYIPQVINIQFCVWNLFHMILFSTFQTDNFFEDVESLVYIPTGMTIPSSANHPSFIKGDYTLKHNEKTLWDGLPKNCADSLIPDQVNILFSTILYFSKTIFVQGSNDKSPNTAHIQPVYSENYLTTIKVRTDADILLRFYVQQNTTEVNEDILIVTEDEIDKETDNNSEDTSSEGESFDEESSHNNFPLRAQNIFFNFGADSVGGDTNMNQTEVTSLSGLNEIDSVIASH